MKNIRRHSKQLIAEDIKAVTEKFGGEVVSLNEVGRENILLKREIEMNRRGVYTAFYAEDANGGGFAYVIISEQRKDVNWHIIRFDDSGAGDMLWRLLHKAAFNAFWEITHRWGFRSNCHVQTDANRIAA